MMFTLAGLASLAVMYRGVQLLAMLVTLPVSRVMPPLRVRAAPSSICTAREVAAPPL